MSCRNIERITCLGHRDAVDIYDATNKLVAFHVLLSPGHRALEVAGITTPPSRMADGSIRGGRSSAIVLTVSLVA